MYKEKSLIYLFTQINEGYARHTPSVTIVHTIQISTTVRLYVHLRQQNTHNPDINQPLLLQYLSLIEQSKVAERWIGLSTVTG
jgi:hypothetical protein